MYITPTANAGLDVSKLVVKELLHFTRGGGNPQPPST